MTTKLPWPLSLGSGKRIFFLLSENPSYASGNIQRFGALGVSVNRVFILVTDHDVNLCAREGQPHIFIASTIPASNAMDIYWTFGWCHRYRMEAYCN
ncbi:hypothetical protein TNCV_3073391 [Trichonephila clavipes]|nr:hypothetical protein TNCV_3073391 [Trichonephila clavipes]